MDYKDRPTSLNELSPESERIRLVPLAEADLVPLQECFLQSDPERLTCRPFHRRTPEELLQHFQESSNSQYQKVYAIRRRDTDQLLGRVSWFDWNPRNRAVEIGFLLGIEFRRCGYGREAISLLLEFLFYGKNVEKVLAQSGAFNDAAIALLTSFGFVQYGCLPRHHRLGSTWHDDLLFGLLVDNFQSGNPK
jgi:RimJ/RimL family protein N-acetyltransferase